MRLKLADPRLRQKKFQDGHMLGIFWDTVGRWMAVRARRDAKSLGAPLILVQAADAATPLMPPDVAKKFMNKANPKDTGGMHGMPSSSDHARVWGRGRGMWCLRTRSRRMGCWWRI